MKDYHVYSLDDIGPRLGITGVVLDINDVLWAKKINVGIGFRYQKWKMLFVLSC